MMKKYTLASFLFAMAFSVIAQTMVTFRVDMTNVAEFNPATDTLRVAGDFQSWTPRDASSANILTDADGNNVYTVTLPVSASVINYKYVINTWYDAGNNEFSGGTPGTPGNCVVDNNRQNTIDQSGSTFELPVYKYNTCESSVASARRASPISSINVTPNPLTTTSRLDFDGVGQSHDVYVVNTVGAVVREYRNVRTGFVLLERQDLLPGIYLVQITSSTGATGARRLVVR